MMGSVSTALDVLILLCFSFEREEGLGKGRAPWRPKGLESTLEDFCFSVFSVCLWSPEMRM